MTSLALFILASSLLAQASAKPAPAAAAGIQPAQPKRISDVYQGNKFRDPFVSLVGAGGGAAPAVVPSEKPANIHDMVLKGIMSDQKGHYAIFHEPNTGSSFILKNGRLLNYKGEAVKGITGTIKGKKVTLITQDKDVEQFSLDER